MLWAAREFATAKLGDARLTQRLISLVEKLAEHPQSSLPEALGEWSATKAAYRFFSNPKVTLQAIYDSHREATLDKMQNQSTILAIQDTTVFNFTLHRQTEGLGPIGQAGLSGFFLHSCLAVSAEGVPQGILAHHMWVRSPEGKDSRNTHKKRTLADKESARWIDMTKEVRNTVPDSTRVIMVGDRESDIFDLFLLAASHHDFLVRAAWDRRLHDSEEYLWHAVESNPILGRTTVKIPRVDDRPERMALLTLQVATVTLRTPPHRKKENLQPPTLTALLVREESSPNDEEPIEWMLLTTLSVTAMEQALQCLTWYTYRWRIERYHYILKSGCQIEKLQLETKDRMTRAVAVYSIVATRLLWLTYQARETPEAPCTVVLRESEWKALYVAKHKSTSLPKHPPNLQTAVLWIAKLGGFLGRKHDGNPGLKVLWKGLRRLEDLTTMWEILHPT